MMALAVETSDARAEDAALHGRAAGGDERAFRALYDAHHRPLFRVAYGVLLDEAEAREAVQEAFLRLHRAAPSWEPRAAVGTWLYRVVLNHCLGLRQRLLRLVFAPAVVRGSTRASPERDVASAQSLRVVEASLAAMSAKQRAVATLYLEAEMAPQEIAELLGITANTARVTLHRALHKLRDDLRAAGIDAPEDDPTFLVDTTHEEDN
jgi:RNA polymerase sigma-70 factor (ECF subfamily)